MSLQAKTEALAQSLAELVMAAVQAGMKVSAKGAPAAEPEAPAAPAKKGRKKAAAPEVTVEDVRTSLLALNEAKGKQAVVDVLARFGVGKIGDLDEAQYAECKELAEAEAAEDDTGDGDGDDDLFA